MEKLRYIAADGNVELREGILENGGFISCIEGETACYLKALFVRGQQIRQGADGVYEIAANVDDYREFEGRLPYGSTLLLVLGMSPIELLDFLATKSLMK